MLKMFWPVLAALVLGAPRPVSAADSPLQVSHVILRVADLDRSIAFFKDIVGLRLQSSNEERAMFETGSVTLMVEEAAKPLSPATGSLASLTEVVLQVLDVKTMYAEMKARGVQFLNEPRAVTTDGSRNYYAAAFRDPDGHVLSIAGWD